MLRKSVLVPALLLILIPFFLSAVGQVTVYNGNFALVRDSAELNLQKGMHNYFLDNIPSTIEANSVIIKPISRFKIFSQNYEYDLANTEAILNKYIGEEIEVVMEEGEIFSGILQFNDWNNMGILDKNGKLTLLKTQNLQNINLAKLPDNFFLKPTLNWKLVSSYKGNTIVDYSYICSGLNWNVTYNAVWNDKSQKLDMSSWVTLNNRSGKTYEDVVLKLIAGDVAKNQGMQNMIREKMAYAEMDADVVMAPSFGEKAFHDFHLYTLSDEVTLRNNQTKQLQLFDPSQVRAKSRYDYFTNSTEIYSKIVFENSKAAGLGIPLPMGVVKIYKLDEADNQMEFIGEDNIDHTPKDEEVVLKTGKAFDLVGKTTTLDNRRISNKVNERDMKVELKNRSEENKTIEVLHHISGNWQIMTSNIDYEKESAYKLKFVVELKAGETKTITWTERITY